MAAGGIAALITLLSVSNLCTDQPSKTCENALAQLVIRWEELALIQKTEKETCQNKLKAITSTMAQQGYVPVDESLDADIIIVMIIAAAVVFGGGIAIGVAINN